ncbi:hypothetical protein CC86DRAFT_450922 [Ophiobolus disseminans]|uniref:DUF6606 domain-containing protein n=1 Tax=Ophiobolus disseminans TaxID=1469910 RepID=A0A6A7AKJ7_9PLEO|nr:hypothetical protein CC86DRAFT_450922 [Ophiobolus disseminans]
MAPSGALRLGGGAVTYLVNHVVLPPKLPQKDDSNPAYDQCLLDVVTCALQDVRDNIEDQDAKETVTSAIQSMKYLDYSRDIYGNVSELQLRKLLENLSTATIDESVPIRIEAQNAGLIVSRSEDSITFEPFELSPLNKAAMGTIGRLVRTFPGCASSIPLSVIKENSFRESIAYTIAKMSTQATPGSQPQVRKTGKMLDEDRDTTDPTIVTDWLMNYIAALGGLKQTSRISKNTREEVVWKDCLHPWRRSPLWLLVRVNLQLLFTRRGCIKQPISVLYKVFVAQLLSRMLELIKENWKDLGGEPLYLTYTKLARRIRKLENLDQLELHPNQWLIDIKSRMTDAHGSDGLLR